MKLSVIIVNYNVKYFLEQCLNSVRKAAAKTDGIDVIVVDNNSVDGSLRMLKEKFPDVKIIANQANLGFAKACNQGIKNSSGEYILLLNPDCVVEEDTFFKTIRFLDNHPEAGALGVKMIDGKGNFLPESKRALPLPSVAFYKLTGLSGIFPHSKIFGRYHLGYLSDDETNEVEILAGAFLMLRRTVLEKTGLPDEDFFMYGEDIDISYRILKAGYKNFYFPETCIIHYKGESTRKTSVNYVLTFYRAMLLFTRKHFSGRQAAMLNILIHIAIYFRAFAAIMQRILSALLLPASDLAGIYGGIYFLTGWWEKNFKMSAEGYYPPEFFLYVLPSYSLIWMAAIRVRGGYGKRRSLLKMSQGVIGGTILILSVYALLPESLRFSRALILLGTVWTIFFVSAVRIFLHAVQFKSFSLSLEMKKRIAIAGSREEASRVSNIIRQSGVPASFIGLVHPHPNHDYQDSEFLGNIGQIEEITRIFKIDEIIFCALDISSRDIISRMAQLNNPALTYKIAPPESLFIIGSNSANSQGELYTVEINSITNKINIRDKRLVDIIVSIVFIPLFPIIAFMHGKAGFLFKNIFLVIAGAKSWVGYSGKPSGADLPKIKPGVFNPAQRYRNPVLAKDDIEHSDLLYARDYRVMNDLEIIWNGIKNQ